MKHPKTFQDSQQTRGICIQVNIPTATRSSTYIPHGDCLNIKSTLLYNLKGLSHTYLKCKPWCAKTFHTSGHSMNWEEAIGVDSSWQPSDSWRTIAKTRTDHICTVSEEENSTSTRFKKSVDWCLQTTLKSVQRIEKQAMKPRKLQKLGWLKLFMNIPIPKATCWWTCSIRLLRPRQPRQWRRLQGWVG